MNQSTNTHRCAEGPLDGGMWCEGGMYGDGGWGVGGMYGDGGLRGGGVYGDGIGGLGEGGWCIWHYDLHVGVGEI